MSLLQTPIEELPATRPQTKKRMAAIGIKTYADLLMYQPMRYEDFSRTLTIANIKEGDSGSIQATVYEVKQNYTRNRLTIQRVTVTDGKGLLEMTWYNQPYIMNIFKKDVRVSVAGTVKTFGKRLVFEPKEYEALKDGQEPVHTTGLVPVYHATYGLSARTIRDKVRLVLDRILDVVPVEEVETLPEEILKKYNLLDKKTALRLMHSPETQDDYLTAKTRFAFEEFFLMQLASRIVKREWKKESVGHTFSVDETKVSGFIASLPFELTGAQQRVISQILEDLKQPHPMNRFVQGDVGSGKTAVAATAAYISALNGFQTLIMAPTEILAQQHYKTVTLMMESAGLSVGLQTRTKKIDTPDQYDIVVGTHALLNQKLNFDRVGLVVIDEQHRFGVAQRAELKEKGMNPHLLSMTATPIPRTVALTIYGELEMSVIDEMPKGRIPIKTSVVPETKRDKAYQWIREQIKEHGIQVYIIFPLIEESDFETMKSVRAANKEFELLKKEIFQEFNVALLHGRMKAKEKDEIMNEFKAKQFDILVSTSVVEVGIDVPNATIMIIEGAERFGLAQLHQLRGRVGRGDKQSYCFLFPSHGGHLNNERLKYFSSTNSGNDLAEYDLKTRGQGDIYGTAQSGDNPFLFADFTNYSLIEKSQQAADWFIDTFSPEKHPQIQTSMERLRAYRIAKD